MMEPLHPFFASACPLQGVALFAVVFSPTTKNTVLLPPRSYSVRTIQAVSPNVD